MNFKKFAMAMVLTASFGLMACGDDNSSSSSQEEKWVDLNGEPMKCSMEEDGDTVITTIKAGAGFHTSKVYITKDEIVTESETHYVNNGTFNDECEKAKKDEGSLYTSVECKDKVVSIVEKTDRFKGYALSDVKAEAEAFCKVVDGIKYKKLNEKLNEFYGDGDDSELDELGEVPMKCSVKRDKDVITMNEVREDGTHESKYYVDGEFIKGEETAKFTHYISYLDACAEAKADVESDEEVVCRGDAVLLSDATPLEEFGSFDEFEELQKAYCEAINGKKSKDYEEIVEEFIDNLDIGFDDDEATEEIDDSIDYDEDEDF